MKYLKIAAFRICLSVGSYDYSYDYNYKKTNYKTNYKKKKHQQNILKTIERWQLQ